MCTCSVQADGAYLNRNQIIIPVALQLDSGRCLLAAVIYNCAPLRRPGQKTKKEIRQSENKNTPGARRLARENKRPTVKWWLKQPAVNFPHSLQNKIPVQLRLPAVLLCDKVLLFMCALRSEQLLDNLATLLARCFWPIWSYGCVRQSCKKNIYHIYWRVKCYYLITDCDGHVVALFLKGTKISLRRNAQESNR